MEPAKMVENPQANDAPSSKFVWQIKGFTSLDQRKLYSDTVVIYGHKWRVLVFPKGNGVNQLSLYLDVADSAVLPAGWTRNARFSLSVLNQSSRRRSVRKETQHQFNTFESDWGFTSFISLQDLLDPCRGFLVNDVVIIELEIQECSSDDSEQISETDRKPVKFLDPPIGTQSETEELKPVESELAKDDSLGDSSLQQEVGQATFVAVEEEGPGIEGSDLAPILSEEVQSKVHEIKDEVTEEVLGEVNEIKEEVNVDQPHLADEVQDRVHDIKEDFTVDQPHLAADEVRDMVHDIKEDVTVDQPHLADEEQDRVHDIKEDVTVDQPFLAEGNNHVAQPELVPLDNDQSTIGTLKFPASLSQSQSETETVNVNGFLVLAAHADSIKQIFEKHPDLVSNFRLRNIELRSSFIAVLYEVIDLLCQSPQDISDDDLNWAKDVLADLEYVGLQTDWLRTKLEEVCKKKERARGCRLDELSKQFDQLKTMMLNLEAELEKEKAETAAARVPLSFNQII